MKRKQIERRAAPRSASFPCLNISAVPFRGTSMLLLAACLTFSASAPARALAQQSSSGENTSAKKLVQEVVKNEIAANNNDHTKWMYRDADRTPAKNVVKIVVETDKGTVSRLIEIDGHPPDAQQKQQDEAKMQKVLTDPAERARQRRNSAHDDKQAVSLMKMLPEGFLWTKTGESNGEISLAFKPNPAFNPPTYASRVFAAMAGTMVVDAKQKRLKDLSGKLIRPVEFGWGILGKMQSGGTFRIVRTQVAPGEWEITQTHVHIQGHALFFKSISEQEDEITSGYVETPNGLSLEQAAKMLTDNSAEQKVEAAEKHPAAQ